MTATTLNQSPVLVQTFMGAIYSSQYYAADTGGVNAISIPLAIAPNAYAEGTIWFTKFANTNTSQTVTAKVGSLAALPVVIDQAGTLPVIGSMISGMFGMLCYSAAQNKLILLNPSRALGSYTLTLTGMSAGTSGTANYAVAPDGKSVEHWIAAAITGTSNASTMTGTGIPALIQPATVKRPIGNWEDSTSGVIGAVSVAASSGTWTFSVGPGLAGGGFTTSGTKGLPTGSKFNYSLD